MRQNLRVVCRECGADLDVVYMVAHFQMHYGWLGQARILRSPFPPHQANRIPSGLPKDYHVHILPS